MPKQSAINLVVRVVFGSIAAVMAGVLFAALLYAVDQRNQRECLTKYGLWCNVTTGQPR